VMGYSTCRVDRRRDGVAHAAVRTIAVAAASLL
jgi:hypothetical protein